MAVPRALFSVAALIFLAIGSLEAKASAVTSEFIFSGTCADCTGFGTGDLILTNYTQGTNITTGNFVSYTYQSNLVSYTITTADLNSITGDLATVPGQDAVTILADSFVTQFISRTNGTWCTGIQSDCLSDNGPTHTWSEASSVPEPATLTLLALGLAGLGAARRGR